MWYVVQINGRDRMDIESSEMIIGFFRNKVPVEIKSGPHPTWGEAYGYLQMLK
jgi:hypothetical protein